MHRMARNAKNKGLNNFDLEVKGHQGHQGQILKKCSEWPETQR